MAILSRTLVLLILILGSVKAIADEPIDVYVAAYEFPPFYSKEMPTHLVGEMITSLNFMQSNYRFILREVPVTARYQALSLEGCCDVMFFETPEWGWSQGSTRHDIDLGVTTPIMRGSERFVMHKREGINEVEFSDYRNKRIGGIAGYHYGFTGKRTTTELLEREYGMYLSNSHMTNIRMLMNDRLDMIMLTDEFIASLKNTEYYNKLAFAPEPDNTYTLSMLVNNDKAIDVHIMSDLLKQLNAEGELDALFRSFNLTSFQIQAPFQNTDQNTDS